MSIAFASASSQYLSVNSVPATAPPVTFAAWVNLTTTGATHPILGLVSGTSADNRFLMQVSSGNQLVAQTRDTTNATSTTTGTLSADTWAHCGAVFAATNSRTAYLNGTAATTDTNTRTPSAPTDIYIARAATVYGNCRIGEAAMWNVALGAADMTALSKGASPLLVRPDALIFYAPMLDQATPSVDRRGGRSLTWNASPTVYGPNPRMYYPAGRSVVFTPAAAAANAMLLRMQAEVLYAGKI